MAARRRRLPRHLLRHRLPLRLPPPLLPLRQQLPRLLQPAVPRSSAAAAAAVAWTGGAADAAAVVAAAAAPPLPAARPMAASHRAASCTAWRPLCSTRLQRTASARQWWACRAPPCPSCRWVLAAAWSWGFAVQLGHAIIMLHCQPTAAARPALTLTPLPSPPQEAVRNQIDYYFSVGNLVRDVFLRSKMNGEVGAGLQACCRYGGACLLAAACLPVAGAGPLL